MLPRSIARACLIALLGLALVGCGALPFVQRQAPPVSVRVVNPPYLSNAPLLIAEAEGYFMEQGIQVELVQITSSSAAIPALAQGEVDVVTGFIRPSILNTIARGGRLRLVADKGYAAIGSCASNALVARRALTEAGTLAPAQLKGRRIEASSGTIDEYYLDKLLGTVGLGLNDVELVETPDAAVMDALAKGAIDLTTSSEPQMTRILQAGHGKVWLPLQDIVPNAQFAMVLYGPSLLDKNPDAGRRFMTAYLKGVRQYNEGKTERNIAVISQRTELEPALVKEACWPAIRSDGQINLESVQDFQAWGVKRGLQDRVVSPDQFWDATFINHAVKTLGQAAR